MSTVLGLDLGHATVAEAEHWLRLNVLTDADTFACTHLVRGDRPRVAISLIGTTRLSPPEPIDLAVAKGVAKDHEARRAGRAVIYPGVTALTGVLSVAEVLAASAIERVLVLAGGPPDPAVRVQTRDFVRPEWRDGLLTLVTVPAAGGVLAPFEVPDPTPCCDDHA